MSELLGWSEDRLAVRHPRYAKIFRRQTTTADGPDRQEADGTSPVYEPDSAIASSRPRRRATPPPPLPAPPQPSADKALLAVDAEESSRREAARRSLSSAGLERGAAVDIWGMKPVQAVNLLCAYVELLLDEASRKPVKPLSPPVSNPSSSGSSRNATPAHVSSSYFPKASHDDVDASTGDTAGKDQTASTAPAPELVISPASSSPEHPHLQRVPRASRTPIDSPISNPRTPIHSMPPSPRLPHIVVTESDRKVQSHHLAKRFFCKSVPNVSLAAYLGRIHKYCHMSTAVYLAAGMYIERLSQTGQLDGIETALPPWMTSAEDEAIVDLTPRSVHRLLLAALRVANKALSDLYWPHKRVADVGGVSQLELQRLEVSMCYLCDFKLQVKLEDLERWVMRTRMMGVTDTASSDGAS